MKRNSIVSPPQDYTSTDIPAGRNGFDAGEKREENLNAASRHVKSDFIPWRVFINHIDSYHGRRIADLLSDSVYVNPQSTAGESLDEEEEEEEYEMAEELQDEETYKSGGSGTLKLSRNYEVIGTTMDPEYPVPEDVAFVIRSTEDRDTLLIELMKCGIVIYDITECRSQVEEARWALKNIAGELESMAEKAPKAFKRNGERRYFILISTLMTWALTKPVNPDDPDSPLTETDYRKRKPHPNFREHVQCEKDTVMIKNRVNLLNKLNTLVICCGVSYGYGEGPLHFLFKMAWQNADYLPILGNGDNKIPLLHVQDLVTIVFTVLQNWPASRYIVAMEQQLAPQYRLVKEISKALATGKVKRIASVEAFVLPEITQEAYDLMTLDLNIEPEYILDKIHWHRDSPFSENVHAIVEEYRAARNLRPVRIIVLGPPASGKTAVAQYLARHYGIHYIHVKPLITEAIQMLSNEIEAAASRGRESRTGNDDGAELDEDLEDDEVVSVEALKEQLDEIRENLHRNDDRLDDIVLNKLFLARLQSKSCLNQGYVLDGYPKTLEQAKELFTADPSVEAADKEDDAMPEAAATSGVNSIIMPELVVSLEASDEFLRERIINRPEREIQNTHYTEEHMIRRLKEFRKRNTDESTPLQFFDEMEVHPLVLSIEDDVCPDMFPTIYQCLERLGKPRNYGLSAREAEELRKRAEAEANEAEMAKKLHAEREMQEQRRKREEKMIEWTNLMESLKEEEEERLCILSLPLRHYLAKYVLPTLTRGLIEVAKLRPDDPVDFLAEYLFRENPEGKMFQPEHTQTASRLLDAIETHRDHVLPREGIDQEVAMVLKREDSLSATHREQEVDVCSGRRMASLGISSDASEEMEMFQRGEDFSTTLSDYGERNV